MSEPRVDVVGDGVVVSQRIAAAPATVFEYFTDPAKMLTWMGVAVDLDPTPGGTFRVDMNGDDVAAGEFVEVAPPHRVVFTWGWDGSDDVPPGSSTVTVTLTADGDQTVVELRHDGLPDHLAARHGEGWQHFLPQLVTAITTP